MLDEWLIWDEFSKTWWKSPGMGTSNSIKEAHRYTLKESEAILAVGNKAKAKYLVMLPSPELLEEMRNTEPENVQ